MAKKTPAKKAAAARTRTATKKTPAKKSSPSPEKPQLRVVNRPEDFKGIEQLIFVEADSLQEHPENWKTHTKRQLDSLDSEFSTVGWALPMVYNLNTGRLLDGHGRKNTKHVKKTGIVPVVVGRWSEEEERQILLHLDPIGAMFETDSHKYKALMGKYKEDLAKFSDQIEETHAKQLEEINTALDTHHESINYGAPKSFLPDFTIYEDKHKEEAPDVDNLPEEFEFDEAPQKLPGAYDLKTWEETPFNAFGKGGMFDIPTLRPDRLGSLPEKMQTWAGPETPEADAYFYVYGSAAIEKVRSSDMIVAFYTHDYKFEAVWNDPRKFTARMINMGIRAVLSPNFSIWEQCPLAFEVWQTYRARWLARYWQEAGLNVIPDILLSNFGDKQRFELRLMGIPRELPCIAVQMQQKGESQPERYYASALKNLLKCLDVLKPQSLLIYHGPDLPQHTIQTLRERVRVVLVNSFMNERQKILKQKEYAK